MIEVSRGKKILARFGVGTINEAKVFQWCPVCKSYQHNDIIDPISHSARTRCNKCDFEAPLFPKRTAGGLALRLQIAIEAWDSSKNQAFGALKFLKVLYFGLSRKEMPDHRHGQTAVELEETATPKVGPWIMTAVNH